MGSVPTLVGIAGHVRDEELPLEYGKKVVVGRSRSADWSLVKLESWTSKSKAEQEEDPAFRTVSGKHFEVTMFNLGSIELVNLSSNGTRLDGKPFDRVTITDVASKSHEISFGADEILRLEVRGEKAGAALEDTLDKLSDDEKKEGEGEPEPEKPEKPEKPEEAGKPGDTQDTVEAENKSGEESGEKKDGAGEEKKEDPA